METYLTFRIKEEYFAVPVTKVLEVLQKQRITSVPKTPEHILGILNFRGDILPVVDTRRKFNLPALKCDDPYVVIVFDTDNDDSKLTIAATADAVRDVIDINNSEIKSVPELGLNYDSKFITGVLQRDENFILMLDIEKVFSSADLVLLNNTKVPEE